jgi:hypothetical protein
MAVSALKKSGINNFSKFRSARIPVNTPLFVEYLVVAGGGGNGGNYRGGAGAGGFRTNVALSTSGGGASPEASLTLNPGQTYAVSVGAN